MRNIISQAEGQPPNRFVSKVYMNSTRILLVLTSDLLQDRRIEDVIIGIFCLITILKIDSTIPFVCSNHRKRENVIGTSVVHSAHVQLFGLIRF